MAGWCVGWCLLVDWLAEEDNPLDPAKVEPTGQNKAQTNRKRWHQQESFGTPPSRNKWAYDTLWDDDDHDICDYDGHADDVEAAAVDAAAGD